jgi:hypothetical protein
LNGSPLITSPLTVSRGPVSSHSQHSPLQDVSIRSGVSIVSQHRKYKHLSCLLSVSGSNYQLTSVARVLVNALGAARKEGSN